MVLFRASTQEKGDSYFFRFDCNLASNDKKVPDPVDSGCNGNRADARDRAPTHVF
jgi:hypothetical protein